MEFVGKTVRKEFKGFGVFSGFVNSYDPSTGFFEILYEDGDSEELDLPEVASLLGGVGMVVNDQSGAVEFTKRTGREPKKRRRAEFQGDSGNSSAHLLSDYLPKESGKDNVTLEKEWGVGENLKKNASFDGDLNPNNRCDGVRSDGGLNLNDFLDLNGDFSLNHGFNLNVKCEEHVTRSGFIDLNLDASGDFEENSKEGESEVLVVGTQRKEHSFDLNLGLDGDIKNPGPDCEGQLKETTSFHVVEKTQKQERGGSLEEARMQGHSKNVGEGCFEVGGGTQMEAIGRSAENSVGDSCGGLVSEVRTENGVNEGLIGRHTHGAQVMDARDFISCGVQLKEGLPDTGTSMDLGYQGNSGGVFKERKRRKRRKLTDDVDSTAEKVLRRSSRRLAEERTQKKEHCFDLNLDLDEDFKNSDADCGQLTDNSSFQVVDMTQKHETGVGIVQAHLGGNSKVGEESCLEVSVRTQMEAIGSAGNKVGNSCVGLVEDFRKENGVSVGLKGGDTHGYVNLNDLMTSPVQLEERIPGCSTPLDPRNQGSGSTRGETNKKTRRKLSDNANSSKQGVVRRSSRMAASSLSCENQVSSGTSMFADNEPQPSPAVSAVSEEKPTTSGREESERYAVLPSKLQLPPSSENLNLNGIPVLDLFSIYACLRSFSTLLFLSPFELEDFVEALKCQVPNLLFDSIHVSLMQTMRKHLEFLSDEHSLSASNCLRSLNWDLLDLITWPIFMVEYLLMHGSGLKPGIHLCKLKLFESEYYKQPEFIKIEILRCLCDDVIEVEAIRAEINRRTLTTELNMDTDWSGKIDNSKRRRTTMEVSGGSCLTEEVDDETRDRNSDECCLCKMDGSLICCDGCPAAYHLKCVGIANSLLPEGDWYCPECVIDKDRPWLKLERSLRGAELLGVDPYGRPYYSSCGYLLVSDSCDSVPTYNYYHRNDLSSVIGALKSSDTFYIPILGAILKQWDMSVNWNEAKSDAYSNSIAVGSEHTMQQIPTTALQLTADIIDKRKPEENFVAAPYSGDPDCEVSELAKNNLVASNDSTKIENPLTSSEGSVETTKATDIPFFFNTGTDGLNEYPGTINDCESQGKILSVGNCSLTSTTGDGEQGKNIQLADYGHRSSVMQTGKGEILEGQLGTVYVNSYSFARSASMVAEDLTRKSPEKITEESIKSVEDLVSAQLKSISKKFIKFSWPSIQNLNAGARTEKCGWCFSCKAPDDDRDCFFNMNDSASEGVASEEVVLHSKKNRKDHLIGVVCYILSIEDRLHGFLLGPWLNPHYTKLWRKSVVKASDVASLKHLLLTLESNLRHLALSAEWQKHVDSVATMGSASHIVTSSQRVSSKHGIGRKRARHSESEPNTTSNAAAGLSLYWWRGGRLSRELFNWKVLPRFFASKAARQAGCTKIPGVLYPDSSEFSKRSKYVAWRAAVESSKSVEQLAIQVREFDANIRWDEIENTNLLSRVDQFRKSVRPFKKVIIRRKCTEDTLVKYLLDFGKRRIIPDIVVTHGSTVEESSSGRKKYWLEESHVPLHLLKVFEEKRLARKCNKISPGKLHASGGVMKKTSKRRGFSYLFTKAERSENYQCGHCSKDVLIREAVCCHYCKGFFHKRHVRKSAGAIAAKGTYTCHNCQDGNCVMDEAKKRKPESQTGKKGSTVGRALQSKMSKKACKDKKLAQRQKNAKDVIALPLRRSPRKLKCFSLPSKKLGGRKKGKGKGKWKQMKSRKKAPKKPTNRTWQKKRTRVYHTYWLNGLLLSTKPNDERVMHFRSKKLLASSDILTAILTQPNCRLCCEQEFQSNLNYVGCEICGDWFHGDAFGLSMENVGNLIGFRCHNCRDRTPPVCPNLHRKPIVEAQVGELETSDEAHVSEFHNKAGNKCTEEVSNITALPTEILEELELKYHTDEESKNLSLDDESSRKDREQGIGPCESLNAKKWH